MEFGALATERSRQHHQSVRGWGACLAALAALAVLGVLFKTSSVETTDRKQYIVEVDTQNTYSTQKVHLSIHEVGSCGMDHSNADDIKGQGILEIVGLDPLQVVVEPCFLEGDISRQIVELPDGRVLYLRSLGRFSLMR